MSFKELYQVILHIKEQNLSVDVCPACQTPIYNENHNLILKNDPFELANKKVKEFEYVIRLETEIENLKKDSEQNYRKIISKKSELTHIIKVLNSTDFQEKEEIIFDEEILNFDINFFSENIDTFLEEIDVIFTNSQKYNQIKSQEVNEQENLIGIYNSLSNIKKNVDLKLEHINFLKEESTKIEIEIREFSEKHSELISKVENEKELKHKYENYWAEYQTFINKLNKYNKQLPIDLVEDLSGLTKKFYNEINRFDEDEDKVTEIILPTTTNEGIKIKFATGDYFDALTILSEGHLKCLGLAILLSKNVSDNIPFIIFDDVVNAIDDEHRSGIINTLFNLDILKEKQMIITTHGEEFLKQIENNLSASSSYNNISTFKLNKKNTLEGISVKEGESRNYLTKAKQQYMEGEYRDSLGNCRRCLENIVTKVWKKSNKKFGILELEISLKDLKSRPEIRSVIDKLVKKLNIILIKEKREIQGVDKFIELLAQLESFIEKSNHRPIKWQYLNQGAHESENTEEFDRVVVNSIIEELDKIDTILESI